MVLIAELEYGMEYGMECWNEMELNSECTQLQLTCVTGAVKTRLNCLLCF